MLSRSILFLACLFLACLLPLAAMAATDYVDVEQRLTAEQLRETGLDGLTPAQLKRLNELLRDDVARTVETAKADGKAEARAEASEERESSSLIGLHDGPISSRLVGSVDGWEPGTVFELQNGQRWKVLKGQMKLRKPFVGTEVKVVPGVAGRWFLQVDEDLPKARVYRID